MKLKILNNNLSGKKPIKLEKLKLKNWNYNKNKELSWLIQINQTFTRKFETCHFLERKWKFYYIYKLLAS